MFSLGCQSAAYINGLIGYSTKAQHATSTHLFFPAFQIEYYEEYEINSASITNVSNLNAKTQVHQRVNWWSHQADCNLIEARFVLKLLIKGLATWRAQMIGYFLRQRTSKRHIFWAISMHHHTAKSTRFEHKRCGVIIWSNDEQELLLWRQI